MRPTKTAIQSVMMQLTGQHSLQGGSTQPTRTLLKRQGYPSSLIMLSSLHTPKNNISNASSPPLKKSLVSPPELMQTTASYVSLSKQWTGIMKCAKKLIKSAKQSTSRKRVLTYKRKTGRKTCTPQSRWWSRTCPQSDATRQGSWAKTSSLYI